MDRSPHSIETAHSHHTRRDRHAPPLIGRRGFAKLAAGTGIGAFAMAGRGLILPWIDFGRAAAAEELVEPEVRPSSDGLLDTTLTHRGMAVPGPGPKTGLAGV